MQDHAPEEEEDPKETEKKNKNNKKRPPGLDLEDADKPAMIGVDIFSKLTQVVPIEDKTGPSLRDGLQKLFETMGGPPETIYTDEEGGLKTATVRRFLAGHHVRQLMTRAHAAVVGRQIRTMKHMILTRLEHSGSKIWRDPVFLNNLCLVYNGMRDHSVTHLTPNQARGPENQHRVENSLEYARVSKRKYPNLSVGDRVKVYTKKKPFDNEFVSEWPGHAYTVESITEDHTHSGQMFYKIEGREGTYMRHELLKVH